jgi:hypothetical protein
MSRLVPTGVCWCGCSTPIGLGSFFAPGHDKRAQAQVIEEVFGDVAHFMAAFGYAPSDAKSVRQELRWAANGARVRAALKISSTSARRQIVQQKVHSQRCRRTTMSKMSSAPTPMSLEKLDEFCQELRSVLETERTITARQQLITKPSFTEAMHIDRLLIVQVPTALSLVLDQVRSERN